MIKKTLRALSHVTFVCFVLALPIGYYPENPDSSEVILGVHGGYGQVASVIRDCSGNPIASESSTFVDVSGEAYFAVPPGKRSPLVLGLRGGYFRSNAKFANTQGPARAQKYTFSYLNTSLNIEKKYIGLGFGRNFGDIPLVFDAGPRWDPDWSEVAFSGHVQLGNLEKTHFMASFAENTPLVSGGSYFDVGMGIPLGKHARLFTGVSGGFYDMGGVITQARFKVSRTLDADLAVRLGEAADIIEGSVAAGLVWRLGARR